MSTTDNIDVYSRWPLTRGAGQFRILILHPSTRCGGDDQVHGSLVVAKLKHEKGKFETLSYVWGSDTLPKKTAFIDGIPFQITTSLDFFLRYLRRTDRPLLLWADGICINQEDDDEKSEQVALMADIYKLCSHVHVWLPDPTDAINTTNRTKSNRSLGGLFSLIAGNHFHDIPGYRVVENTHELTFEETDEFLSLWKGFLLMANSPWWTRAWTAQEMFLPPRVLFHHYAAEPCDIQLVDDSHERLWQHRDGPRSCCTRAIEVFPESKMAELLQFYLGFAYVQHRRELRFRRRSSDGRDCFYSIVMNFSNRQCYNARDRIYSLWSMTSSFYKDCPVDYLMSEGVIFTSIFECMLREAHYSRGHLNNFLGWGMDYRILQWMSFGPDTAASGTRPSWVPDFSRSWDHQALQAHRGRIAFSKLYQPSGWSRGHVRVKGKQLHLRCFHMDTIRVVGEAVDNPQDPESLKRVFGQWKLILRQSGFDDTNNIDVVREKLAALLCAEICAERMSDDQFAAWRRKFLVRRIGNRNIFAVFFEYAFNVIARSEHWRRLQAEDIPGIQELDAVLESGDLTCFRDGRYRLAVGTSLYHRAIYLTEGGRIGLCLPHTNAGDEIWGVYGFRVPFVFRRLDGDGRTEMHSMIGDCYLQGAMDGELLSSGSSTVVKLV